jgi:peptide-methionine (S)-S-oxide reductase
MTEIKTGLIVLVVIVVAVMLFIGGRRAVMGTVMGAERREPIPAPTLDEQHPSATHETAVLAGGCFWGVQTVFQRVKGVTATTAGYSGGTSATATYDQVSSERTDHAESVKVVFNPEKVSYGTLLRIFFSVVHDPTQLNRQGPDVGTSYRSVIFYGTPEQEKIAKAYIAQLDAAHVFPKKIVTQVVPLKAFYDGEDYHQDYAEKNPNNPYIQVCDVPKMAALQQQFPDLFQDYKHK